MQSSIAASPPTDQSNQRDSKKQIPRSHPTRSGERAEVPLARDDNVETRPKASSICRSLQLVQSHYERIAEAPLAGELSRKALCLALRRKAAHTHAIEASRRRLKILHEHGVMSAQIRSQPVRVLALLKRTYLNREGARER